MQLSNFLLKQIFAMFEKALGSPFIILHQFDCRYSGINFASISKASSHHKTCHISAGKFAKCVLTFVQMQLKEKENTLLFLQY